MSLQLYCIISYFGEILEESLEDCSRADETPVLRQELKKSQEITEQLDLNPRKRRNMHFNSMCVSTCGVIQRIEAADMDLSRTNQVR